MSRASSTFAVAACALPALAVGKADRNPAATIGEMESAKWSDTTEKSTATPENQQQLKEGKAGHGPRAR
jgi:hypothetical protein